MIWVEPRCTSRRRFGACLPVSFPSTAAARAATWQQPRCCWRRRRRICTARSMRALANVPQLAVGGISGARGCDSADSTASRRKEWPCGGHIDLSWICKEQAGMLAFGQVTTLLLNAGSRIDAQDGDSNTPLHHTSRSDLLFNVSTLLLNRGTGKTRVSWFCSAECQSSPLDEVPTLSSQTR